MEAVSVSGPLDGVAMRAVSAGLPDVRIPRSSTEVPFVVITMLGLL